MNCNKTLWESPRIFIFLMVLQFTLLQFLHHILKHQLIGNYVIIFFKLMKQHHASSNENTINLALAHQSDSSEIISLNHTTQNQKINDLTFVRSKGNKQKKIRKKPDTIMQKLAMMAPASFNHVYNFLNILSINEQTLKDPSSEESFFKSMFYVKNIEKVEMRKNAIILFTRNIENTLTPVQYLVERFRSFGDRDFLQLADTLQQAHRLYLATNFTPDLLASYDGEPLSRFIEAMQARTYACKVAPNKIVISRRLLEVLGEDMELYGLKLCKYKTPFREIISGASYFPVIRKALENVGLVSEFLRRRMSFEELQERASLEFNDYLYTRHQKKIYGRFRLYMPTSLINCLELVQQISEADDCERYWKIDPVHRRGFDRECNEQRYLEAETLRHLIEVSDSMLVNNRKRLAGYYIKE